MAERKPFHESIESILDSISRGCGPFSIYDLLSILLKETKIPKNHEALIGAWAKYRSSQHINADSGVSSDLREQKQEAEAEARRRHEAEMREIIEDAREDCN